MNGCLNKSCPLLRYFFKGYFLLGRSFAILKQEKNKFFIEQLGQLIGTPSIVFDYINITLSRCQKIVDIYLQLRNKLGPVRFKEFQEALLALKKSQNIKQFIVTVDQIVPKHLKYVLVGIDRFVTGQQQIIYRDFLRRSNLPIPEDL